ncbi:hypothetical protein CKAN_01492400 [Cinnamomum micranthum f. kanehirae]|uniref:Uncharacterized protein n=1 Tax=Cinnamomum micranthum f. kanehirae TaxID=337451 RepID=A0A443P5J5_9MAGN|nr:hypothetical protein CKAN_01492400 [Cinnamomum micranthum f. kanehirae]
MTLSFMLRYLIPGRQLLFYAASWTALLTVTVAVASFAPEMAFVWAITPSSGFSRACGEGEGAVRIPLDGPGEVMCFPAELFKRSKMDLFVPPAFAAVVVAAAAFVVRAVGLWEDERDLLV